MLLQSCRSLAHLMAKQGLSSPLRLGQTLLTASASHIPVLWVTVNCTSGLGMETGRPETGIVCPTVIDRLDLLENLNCVQIFSEFPSLLQPSIPLPFLPSFLPLLFLFPSFPSLSSIPFLPFFNEYVSLRLYTLWSEGIQPNRISQLDAYTQVPHTLCLRLSQRTDIVL